MITTSRKYNKPWPNRNNQNKRVKTWVGRERTKFLPNKHEDLGRSPESMCEVSCGGTHTLETAGGEWRGDFGIL